MFKIASILLIYLLSLSSCGFKALYKNEALSTHLNAIEIESINSIEGAELHLYLTNLLPLTQKPLYILKIGYTYVSSPLAIQKNAGVIRENTGQNIHFNLVKIDTGKIIASGSFKQMTSYNSTFTPYGSHVEKELARINLTRYSAEEIRRRLILYFKSHEV